MDPTVLLPFYFMKQRFQCTAYDEQSLTMDWEMEPTGSVPTHVHEHMDEHFTITSGEGKFVVDGKTHVLKAGDTLMVLKGIPHSIYNKSKEVLVCRVVYSPCSDTHTMFGIFGSLYRDNPKDSLFILKADYLTRQARLKRFSQPHPPLADTIIEGMMKVISSAGGLAGWSKLKARYLGEEAKN